MKVTALMLQRLLEKGAQIAVASGQEELRPVDVDGAGLARMIDTQDLGNQPSVGARKIHPRLIAPHNDAHAIFQLNLIAPVNRPSTHPAHAASAPPARRAG